MKQMNISLDFKELDKLPAEQYNELERKYLKYLEKVVDFAEEDYCKKKGLVKAKILQNYPVYKKMRDAVNQRKQVRETTETCMKFNKMLRHFVFDKKEVKNK